MSGVTIKYFDGAYNAKQDFEINWGDKSDYCNPDLFMQDNFTAPRYDLLLELNAFLLDGNAQFVDDDEPENTQIAFLSSEMSDNNGDFAAPYILLFLDATTGETYDAPGLTVVFDVSKNVYATEVIIAWEKNGVTVEQKTFYPDAPVYYFERDSVSDYDSIGFMFKSINLPKTSLRVNSIDHGKSITLGGANLRNARMIQEINPVSLDLPTNTFDAEIETDGEIKPSENDALEIYFNDRLLDLVFVKSAKQKAENIWRISAEDYVGGMSDVVFAGGQYEADSAVDVLQSIFATANVPYEIDDAFENAVVTGSLAQMSCRDALMQVCFAIGAVADTTGRKNVAVFPLDDTIPDDPLPSSRIMIEQDAEDEKQVSEVDIVVPTFVETNNEQTIFTAQNPADNGKTFIVNLSEPMYNFHTPTGLDSYIIFDASKTTAYTVVFSVDFTGYLGDSVDIIGKKYDIRNATYTKSNAAAKKQNVVSIEDAGLVSVDNVDDALDRVYNYYVGSRNVNTRIVDGRNDEPTAVGEIVEIPTKFGETFLGRIVKQSYGLNGGILVKESVVRQYVVPSE